MHSGDLTREQSEKLHERLRPMLDYLAQLQQRMDETQFSHVDIR